MKTSFWVRLLPRLLCGVSCLFGPLSVIRAAEPIVAPSAEWKYLDTGADLGTAWSLPTFDDSSWAAGPATLGFGDGDEATHISSGLDFANKYVTAYFRRAFEIPNVSTLSNLTLRVLVDDGAVVYLNGLEIFRQNLPSGAINFKTLASAAVEKSWLTVPFPTAALLSGRNVLAAEVHQVNITSSDLEFALELTDGTETPPAELPLVTIQAVDASATERHPALGGTPDTGLFRIFRTGGTTAALAVTLSYSGTAQNGIDTELLPTTVEIAAGSLVADVSLTVRDDAVSEGPETMIARILSSACANEASPGPGCYRVGAAAEATVTIEDDDTNSPPGGLILIPAGAVWKFLDNGSDQGSAWRSPSFDDALWAEGPAQLGYGDGDEATVVSSGPNPGQKNITTYFRHAFDVANASSLSDLVLRVLRDDGVAIYLNGVEIFRNNLPAGDIAFDRLAASVAVDENTFIETTLSPTLLVTGRNVIAAEVHQVNAVSSDIGFDLELRSGSGTPLPNLPVITVEAIDNSAAEQDPALDQIPDVGIWRLWRAGPTNEAVVVNLSYDGSAQNGIDLIPLPETIEIMAGQRSVDLVVAVIDDALTEGIEAITLTVGRPACAEQPEPGPGCYFVGASARATVTIRDNEAEPPPPPTGTNVLVAAGATWKYLDDGSDQGISWRDLEFEDSAWAAGPAQLGYGDGDEATVVSGGPEAFNRYITTYFRHSFEVTDAAAVRLLTVGVLRDDGVALYLNGVEVLRNNLPNGDIDYHTLANIVAVEENAYNQFTIPPEALRSGINVIAAEIHQANPSSSDISFDLELRAIVDQTPTPEPVALELRAPLAVAGPERIRLVIRGDPAGINILETSLDLEHWMEVMTLDSSELGSEMTFPISRLEPCRFYRVRAIVP